MIKLHALSILAGICLAFNSFGQNSLSPNLAPQRTMEHEMMFRKTVWRTIDLREKQNKPLFASNQQITKVIIDAVRNGELPIYRNDSLTSRITKDQFFENMTMVNEEPALTPEEIVQGFNREDEESWPGLAANNSLEVVSNEFLPKELYLLELKEDAVFDKNRSRMYHEIQSLSVIVPASLKTNLRKRDILVGTFKYDDLIKVFRQNQGKASWVNPHNDAQNKNLAEALELRLFNSFITKVSNPDDASLEEIHGGPMEGLLASQQAADKLLEYEYNLWSF